jgi:hypothetical protein
MIHKKREKEREGGRQGGSEAAREAGGEGDGGQISVDVDTVFRTSRLSLLDFPLDLGSKLFLL